MTIAGTTFTTDPFYYIFSRGDGVLPILESLPLTVDDQSDDRPLSINVFCRAMLESGLFSSPSLRHVTLEGGWNTQGFYDSANVGDAKGLLRTWSPLTELEVKIVPGEWGDRDFHFDTSHVLEVLKNLPSLVTASFMRTHQRRPNMTLRLPHPTSLLSPYEVHLWVQHLRGHCTSPRCALYVSSPATSNLASTLTAAVHCFRMRWWGAQLSSSARLGPSSRSWQSTTKSSPSPVSCLV